MFDRQQQAHSQDPIDCRGDTPETDCTSYNRMLGKCNAEGERPCGKRTLQEKAVVSSNPYGGT
jgi:hypothetical protein